MFSTHITKEEINELELRKYEGKVSVVNTIEQLSDALQHIREYHVFGFDTETKPAFKKGVKHLVALLQIAIPDMVYLIRLNHLGFTHELAAIFEDEQIEKVGISIRDDLKHLKQLGDKYHVYLEPQNITELNDVARNLEIEHEGVKKLTAIFLEFRVSKSQQTTNWENPELTEKQIRYAATDAWVCLEIHQHLRSKGYI